MATNPITIPINGDSSGQITCQSNAAYYQRVTLEWTVLSAPTIVVFSGTGEGVQMQTEGGATQFDLPTTRQPYSINVLFEYSQNGSGGPFYKASVQDPVTTPSGKGTLITIASEDSTDNDNNDSILSIFSQPL